MKVCLSLLILFLIPTSLAYGSEITYSSPIPDFYSYDCNDPSPHTFTKSDPGVSKFKYFSYFNQNHCFSTLISYDVTGLGAISNATSVNIIINSKGSLITDTTKSNSYNVPCKLYYFNNPDLTSGAIIQVPQNYGSFSCTGNSTNPTKSNTVSLSPTQITAFQNSIKAGNYTFSVMVFPTLNATMQTNLNTNHYEYGIQKFQNSLYVNGDGFNCAIIAGSGMCNFLDKPWTAIAIAYGQEWIGPWFFVLVFFPFPMATYLITRNGTYAGFVGLGIMLAIQSISPTIFEIALTMILISASFGFYEVIKRRLLS
jgi:hypothetical protein